MRKRSSYPPRPLTPGQITALSDQFICNPASRSIDDIEMAGEIMRDLLKQRDELLAAIEKMLDALVISVPMAFAAAIQNMDIEDDDAEEIHAIGAALAEGIPDDGRTVRETLRFLTTVLSIAQSTIASVKGGAA